MKGLCRFVRMCYGLMFLCIFCLVLFCSNEDFLYKKTFLHGNLVYAAIGVAIAAVSAVFVSRPKARRLAFDEARINRLVAVAAAALFVIQLYIFHNIMFASGWDSSIIVKAARYSAGYSKSTTTWYYSFYPNNLLIIQLYGLLLKINVWGGLLNKPYDLMCIIALNTLLNALSCYMVYVIVRRLYGAYWAVVAFVVSVLLFGISPWSAICYSDGLALFFPTLIICLYTWKPTGKVGHIIRYGGMVCASCLGYMFKPYVLITSMAVILVSACRMASQGRKQALRGIAIIAGLCLCFIGVHKLLDTGVRALVERVDGIEIDDEQTHDWQHFFMMGMNTERQGVFSQEDCNFSEAIPTRRERARSNLEVAFSRIRDMKLSGFLNQMKKKMLITFHDGTFSWGIEGNFFKKIYDPPNQGVAPALRQFYYVGGSYYQHFMSFEQCIWIFMLLMSLLASLSRRKASVEPVVAILMLTLVGFVIYEALFEVRARYAYTYTPVIAMLATMGLKACADLAVGLRKKRGEKE